MLDFAGSGRHADYGLFGGSAVVLAPHMDDGEIVAAGGTIARCMRKRV